MTAPVQPRVWQFELTGPILNANQRLHWRQERERKATWRDMAHQKAIATVGANRPTLERARVHVYLIPRDTHPRDAENIAPLAKSVVDGLVAAAVLAGDDTSRMPAPTLAVESVPRRGQPRGTYTVHVMVEEVLG